MPAKSHHETAVLDLGEFRPHGELLNFYTHLLGAVLSVLAAGILLHALWGTEDRPAWWAAVAYSASLVTVYVASTLSHAFHRPSLRHFWRTIDQVCIFFLIAGSVTPWCVAYFRDRPGLIILGTMWGLALVGAFVKLFLRGLKNVATIGYIALGWLPLLMVREIVTRLPMGALVCLTAGGLLYTLGTYFLHRDLRIVYYHAVWHLMVIAASACHFIGVMLYVVPKE